MGDGDREGMSAEGFLNADVLGLSTSYAAPHELTGVTVPAVGSLRARRGNVGSRGSWFALATFTRPGGRSAIAWNLDEQWWSAGGMAG